MAMLDEPGSQQAIGSSRKVLIYDILFFVGMTGISIFMMAHIGILSGARNTIDRLFEKNPDGQKPVG